MSEQELKPCPFCGAAAKMDTDIIYQMVTCTDCTANTGWWDSEAKAAEAWNQRLTLGEKLPND